MGNFFFSWLGAQTECYVCVCEGGVLCWGFNNRNNLCYMKIFAAKNVFKNWCAVIQWNQFCHLSWFWWETQDGPSLPKALLSSPACSLACPNTLFWELMLFWKSHPLFSFLWLIFQIMSLPWIGEWVATGCDLDLLKNVSSSPCQESIELN